MDPRELFRQADELRAQAAEIAGHAEITQEERDRVLRMEERATVLVEMAQARLQQENDELRAAAEGGRQVGGTTAEQEQVDALRAYIRSGEQRAALLAGTDANGGYLVPEPIHAALVELVESQNPIAANATVFRMSGATKMELPRKTGRTASGWSTETGSRTAGNAPTLGIQTLEAFEGYAMPEATQTFLDTVANAEQFIIDDIAASIRELTSEAYCVGDGNGKPSGVFAGTSFYTTKLSAGNDALDAAQIIAAYFALPSKYLLGSKWYMAPSTAAVLATLAWPNVADTPLVKGVEQGNPTIMGKPIVLCDDAPTIGNGKFPVAFGDLGAGYAVGIHRDVSTLRDPFSNKPYVQFYSTFRVGGVPWDPQALLLLKSDNA